MNYKRHNNFFLFLIVIFFLSFSGTKLFAVTIELLHPDNTLTITIPNPYFQWETSSTIYNISALGTYTIEISTDQNFTDIIDKDTLPENITWYVPNLLLDYDQTYFWRITSFDHSGVEVVQSSTRSFSVIPQPEVYHVSIGTDYESFKQILAEASANTPSILRLEEGTHTFDPGNDLTIIDISNVTDLVIEGAGKGADIISKKAAGFVSADNCHRILFKNMTFDLDPLRYTAGEVISKNNQSIIIELLPGHPTLESDQVLADRNNCFFMHGNPPRISSDVSGLNFNHTWENIGNGQYRLTPENTELLNEVHLGDVAVIEDRYGLGTGFIKANVSNDIIYYNIVGYSGANNGFTSHHSDRLRILNSGFVLKPGRYITLNAGGTNFHDSRLGPWMENCTIENVGDDGHNTNASVRGANAKVDLTTVDLFQTTGRYTPSDPEEIYAPGDVVLILDPQTGNYIERSVTSCSWNGNNLRVSFDNDIGPIVIGDVKRDNKATRFINLNRNSNQHVQRSIIYKYVQRNAIVLGCTGGWIEKCRIVGCGNRAITSGGPNRPNSWRATNVLIRDLYIEDPARINHRLESLIVPFVFRKLGIINEQGMDFHKNILFEGIRFKDCPEPYFNITATENYIIRDTITIPTQDLSVPPVAPTSLSASKGNSQNIKLTWIDNAENEDGYIIERKTTGSFVEIAAVGPDVVSFSDTCLLDSVLYTYRVKAYIEEGNSTYSDEVSEYSPSSGSTNIQIIGEQNEKLIVFPNPVLDKLTISSKHHISIVSIITHDGQFIKTLNDPQKQIDLSVLKAGVYILRVKFTDGSATSVKIIKL